MYTNLKEVIFMIERYFFEAESEDVKSVNEILTEVGIDMQIAIRMFFKRVIKERSISFILNSSEAVKNKTSDSLAEKMAQNVEEKSTELSPYLKEERGGMTKSIAVRLFRSKGDRIGWNVTYASKNRSAYNYWANPEFGMLSNEWNIILNDWVNRTIFLFTIPANTIDVNSLHQEVIDGI